METILLTKKNAHRATMVRRKDDPASTPVPFRWRGERRFGIGNFDHLLGDGDEARIIKPHEFDQWEVVETSHPGYLEELWDAAYRAHYWSSQNPDIRGEDEITQYEKELHDDLTAMPEEQREQYLSNYKSRLSGVWASESRVASAYVTGPAKFNYRRNEKANNAYRNKYEAFRQWRERALKAVERYRESLKTDEQRADELWRKVEADIDSTAATIHGIDTGKNRGCCRALFVSNLFGRIATYAKNGNVEIVERAVARVREWNAKCQKPIVTERHSLFKLPDVARSVRQKAEQTANRENKEVAFEGGKVVFNYAEDRLQILFDKVPEKEFRERMQREFSFNWSRRNMAWQRQLTDNAVRAARRLLGIDNM
uniref:hypothetical protein n=1 Tax=Alistipes sp. D31t1_170403_E11 TaxID=2787128 RepID=UPI00189912BB|nr:hypothetical protein [Alistipes sp. D31t1_170403_E11]